MVHIMSLYRERMQKLLGFATEFLKHAYTAPKQLELAEERRQMRRTAAIP